LEKDAGIRGGRLRNLEVFKELCGAGAFRNVVLLSSFWDVVDYNTAIMRETELKDTPHFWGNMIRSSAKVMRFDNSRTSGLAAVNAILNYPTKITLDIQREMLLEVRPLIRTSAGQAFWASVQGEIRQFKGYIDILQEDRLLAMSEKDDAFLQNVLEEIGYKEKKVAEFEKIQEILGIGFTALC
jgi:hypothetical protein